LMASGAIMPICLVQYCMTLTPLLDSLEVVGCTLAENFEPEHFAYEVRVLDEWKERLTFMINPDLTLASKFKVCFPHPPPRMCQRLFIEGPKYFFAKAKQNRAIKAVVPTNRSNIFYIELLGMNKQRYSFTIVGLQSLQVFALNDHVPLKPVFANGVEQYEKVIFTEELNLRSNRDETLVRAIVQADLRHLHVEISTDLCFNGDSNRPAQIRSVQKCGPLHIYKFQEGDVLHIEAIKDMRSS